MTKPAPSSQRSSRTATNLLRKKERAMSDSSWEIEAQKRINQLAVLVDFARRAERYAKDTGNKFLAEKARAVLAEIKGGNHE